MFENIAGQIIEEFGGAVYNDILDELRTGEQLRLAAGERRAGSMAEVTGRKNRGIDGLGYVDMDVPDDVYFDWAVNKPGFWQDPANKAWFLKKNPQFKVGYEARAAIAWTPRMDRSGGGLLLADSRTSLATMRTAQ